MNLFDSGSGETGKITVRGVSVEVLQALNQLAATHDRSVEAEARQALRVWVAPQVDLKQREKRAAAVARRLNFLQEELATIRPGPTPLPSHFAELMGFSHADDVERWFAGEGEPSFQELYGIADLVGCNRDWLVHGEGHPFSSQYARIPESPKQGVEWLLDGSSGTQPELHLIRNMSKDGEFALVKRFSEWRAQTIRTPYHISESIGAGGESSLASLFLIWERLYKHWTKSNLLVEGHLLDESQFSALLGGKRHPLNVIPQGEKSCWWEDIWDVQQMGKHEYWPGWHSLTQRIRRVIDARPSLNEERQRLRAEDGNAAGAMGQ